MAKKIMKRSLALGALMAFVITGSAFAAEITDIADLQGTNLNDGRTITDDINVIATSTIYGIYSYQPGAEISINSNNIRIETQMNGFYTSNPEMVVGVFSGCYDSNDGSVLNLGSQESIVNIKSTTRGFTNNFDYFNAIGLWAYNGTSNGGLNNGGIINVSGKEVNIEAYSRKEGAYGIFAQNRTIPSEQNKNYKKATVDINAENINISAKSDAGKASAIVAMSEGVVNINGNLQAIGDNSILVRGDSHVNINTNGANTTILKGNINFAYDRETSDTKIDSFVNVVLSDEKSVFEGSIIKTGITDDLPEWKKVVTGMNITFKNGATWNLTGASIANDVTFGAGSNLKIKGVDFVEDNDVYALNGNGNDFLKVEKGANLVIEGMEKNTYNIAKGFVTNEGTNFTVVNDNALMQAEMVLNDANELKAVVTAKSASEIANSGISSEASSGAISQIAGELASANGNLGSVPAENQAAAAFIKEVMSGAASGTKTAQNMKDAMDSALNIGENVGANANAAAVVNNVTGITTQRMSYTQMNTAPQGGHGKVERKYKTGEGVWAQYMHGKDKVEDMPMGDTTTSYDSQYNGIVFGYDFKEVGKTHTGIAFNYGSGDSNGSTSSTHSRSEFDFWGVGLYHSIMNDDTNLIFDINYNKSDTDVTQTGLGGTLTANPKTETMSFGVKAEKLIQNGPVQIVPYAGARFLTIDTDDYHVAGLNATYAPERQNVWLIPVGVSLRQENTYENGWKVTPKADLSYIWALGDTDSSMSVAVGNATPFTNKYTVMDNGSFLGTLGIEAAKGDWTYGLSYSYQKGEYQSSDKWFVDVRYSF